MRPDEQDAPSNVTLLRDTQDNDAAAEELRIARELADKAQKKAEELAQLSLYDPSPLIRFDVDHQKLLYVNPAAFNRYSDIFRKGADHPLLANLSEIALRAFVERRTMTREVSIGAITYQQSITPNLLGDEHIVTLYNHDISRLKQTEENLRQATINAEAASRAKSEFLANVSHELRTPMNGVLGMASLLRDSHLDSEQRELVNIILQSGESLLTLLNDVLDLSKIEANEMTLEHLPFNLRTLTDAAVRIFDPAARQKKIDLTLSYSPVSPECVVGDPARIRQILTNLIGNALKFTDHGFVRVSVTTRRVQDGRTEIMFRVDDSGIGIDEQNIEKIFNKFTQADSSTSRKYGGTGLGLTICKLLAEAMGGSIGVESKIGMGSSFWFSIPMAVADAEQTKRLSLEAHPEQTTEPAADFTSFRVLVVDDHPVNLFFARKLLEKNGFRHIDAVEDGRTALNLSAQTPYDLIILDCQMPGMDGYQVSRSIRERETVTGKRVPIVAMTANAMVGDREKCVEAGMDDYISKPITQERMLEVLLKWLKVSVTPAAEPKAASCGIQPVDLQHLRDYIGDDEEERRVVVEMFMTGAEESVAVMSASLETGDSVEWKKAAHKLKGSAANFGAEPLRALCADAEMNYEAPLEEKRRMAHAIAEACGCVRDFMNKA